MVRLRYTRLAFPFIMKMFWQNKQLLFHQHDDSKEIRFSFIHFFPACTDTLDSSEKCSVCRGDSWYWNSDESSCNGKYRTRQSLKLTLMFQTVKLIISHNFLQNAYHVQCLLLECGMGGCLKCDTADVCEQCPSGMWFDQQATSCQGKTVLPL